MYQEPTVRQLPDGAPLIHQTARHVLQIYHQYQSMRVSKETALQKSF